MPSFGLQLRFYHLCEGGYVFTYVPLSVCQQETFPAVWWTDWPLAQGQLI